MRTLRRTIKLGQGVEVDLLFTPHLFSFRGFCGLTFDTGDGSEQAAIESYADIFYAAALNSWVLDKGGDPETAPFRRGDFHEFMVLSPAEFGRLIPFAVQALTGKDLKEYTHPKEDAEKGKKKALSRLIGKILRRS